MNRPTMMRFFGILLTTAVLASGCTPAKEAGRSGEAVAVAAPRVVVQKAKVREMDPTDKQIQTWSLAMKKSHEIFREVWAHVWEDRLQNPMSVFLDIERQLRAHKNPEDGHFRPVVRECPQRASQIELIHQANVVTGAIFYQLNCGKKAAERTEMARVIRVNGHDEWTFYAENMSRSAGVSLSLLKERTRCRMDFDARERLRLLDCQNLGQNRDSETHLLFSQFRYEKGSDTLVLVEGKKYKLLTTAICDNPKFCTRLRVPLSGRIEIFEDHVSQVAREERQRVHDMKEREEELKESRQKHETAVAEMRARVQSVQKAQNMGGTHVLPPGGVSVPGQHAVLAVPAHQVPVVTPDGRVMGAEDLQNQAEAQIQAQGQTSFDDYDFSQVVQPGQTLPPEISAADHGMQRMEFGHEPRPISAEAAAAAEQAQREGYLPGEVPLPREAYERPPDR